MFVVALTFYLLATSMFCTFLNGGRNLLTVAGTREGIFDMRIKICRTRYLSDVKISLFILLLFVTICFHLSNRKNDDNDGVQSEDKIRVPVDIIIYTQLITIEFTRCIRDDSIFIPAASFAFHLRSSFFLMNECES